MKTPMQELIEQLEEKVKEAEYYSDESRFGLYGALDIAKSMLDKEKESYCEFAEEYVGSCLIDYPKIEVIFNQTFKTKEK